MEFQMVNWVESELQLHQAIQRESMLKFRQLKMHFTEAMMEENLGKLSITIQNLPIIDLFIFKI